MRRPARLRRGEVIASFSHPAGLSLHHLKARSRFKGWARQGLWALSYNGELLAILTYYNQPALTRPPIRWANRQWKESCSGDAANTARR